MSRFSIVVYAVGFVSLAICVVWSLFNGDGWAAAGWATGCIWLLDDWTNESRAEMWKARS